MIRTRSLLTTGVIIVSIFAIATACGDGGNGESTQDKPGAATKSPGKIEAVVTSSDLAVGSQRFAFVLLEDDVPVSADAIAVRFFKLMDEANPELVGEGAIPFSPLGIPGLTTSGSDLTGVYYANIDFDVPGKWGAGFTIGPKSDVTKETRVSFEVKDSPSTVGIGEKAIPVNNPTLKNATLKEIDTSPKPDEAFHQISIADALKNGKPSLIAFATPSFCETRTCGPTMEVVRAAYEKFGDKVNWVHVEPFQLDKDGGLLIKAGERVNAEAGNLWSLPSEPWVFVVDPTGVVAGRFDGPLTLEEVDFYLTQLTKPVRKLLRGLPLWLAAVVVGSFALIGVTRGALAHAEPDEIRPGDGAVVTTAPVAIEIVMSQELARQEGANGIDVFAADGTEVTTEAATMDLKDRRRISVPLPTNLAPGTYTVKWKTLSADDGDSEDGELSFTYDPDGVATPGREQLGDAQPVVPTVAVTSNADTSPFSNERQSKRDTWVAAAAAAIAGAAIGGALTFLLVQRRAGPSA